MTTAALLDILLTALQHTAELSALYQKASLEGRDLTDDEVAAVKAKAKTANDKLHAQG